jgi:hypothetical protein
MPRVAYAASCSAKRAERLYINLSKNDGARIVTSANLEEIKDRAVSGDHETCAATSFWAREAEDSCK